jgi:hypothetical protein
MAPEPREPGMWQQFRRRRVIRTVLVYLALAYLAIELTHFTALHVELPPWGLRAVLGAAVLGFPLAVVLAWTYDVTPVGIVRTPDDPAAEPPPPIGPRLGWALLGTLALLAAIALRWVRG